MLLGHPNIDVNLKGEDECTPLICAARNTNVKMIRLLLAHPGIEVNLKDREGHTALSWTIKSNRKHATEAAEALLYHPTIDVNITGPGGYTPLSAAVLSAPELVGSLLKHSNIQANTREPDGYTPLSRAARLGYTPVVKALLEHANSNIIDVNIKDQDGHTLLSRVICLGYYNIAEVLLDHAHSRVDVNVKDHDGYTPAVRLNDSFSVQSLLNYVGIEPNESSNNLGSLLRRYLPRSAPGADFCDIYERSPLFWSASSGDKRTVSTLLEKASINLGFTGSYYGCPLQAAIGQDPFRLLLETPAYQPAQVSTSVQLCDRRGRNCLACLGGIHSPNHLNVVEQLLCADANIFLKDAHGWTPVFCASRSLNPSIREFFQAASESRVIPSPYRPAAWLDIYNDQILLVSRGCQVSYDEKLPPTNTKIHQLPDPRLFLPNQKKLPEWATEQEKLYAAATQWESFVQADHPFNDRIYFEISIIRTRYVR